MDNQAKRNICIQCNQLQVRTHAHISNRWKGRFFHFLNNTQFNYGSLENISVSHKNLFSSSGSNIYIFLIVVFLPSSSCFLFILDNWNIPIPPPPRAVTPGCFCSWRSSCRKICRRSRRVFNWLSRPCWGLCHERPPLPVYSASIFRAQLSAVYLRHDWAPTGGAGSARDDSLA